MEKVVWVNPSEVIAIPETNLGRPSKVADTTGFSVKPGTVESKLIDHLAGGYSVATGAAMVVMLLSNVVGKLSSLFGDAIDVSIKACVKVRTDTYAWLQREHPEVAKVYWAMYTDAKGQWLHPKYLVVSGNMRSKCLPFAVTNWVAADKKRTVDGYKLAIVEYAFTNEPDFITLQCRENRGDDKTAYADIDHIHLAMSLLTNDRQLSEADIARIVGIAERGKQQKVFAVANLCLATWGLDLVKRFALEPRFEGEKALRHMCYDKGGHVPLKSITWQEANALLGIGKARGTDAGKSPAKEWVPFTLHNVQPLEVVEDYFKTIIVGRPAEREGLSSNAVTNLANDFANFQSITAPVFSVLKAIVKGDSKWFAELKAVEPPKAKAKAKK